MLSSAFDNIDRYQPANAPAYKFFSADYIIMGYRGIVIEVGLFYSMMTTDTGFELRVPNEVILKSAVVDYRPTRSAQRSLQVRYEFSIGYDPDAVITRIKESLSDLRQVGSISINLKTLFEQVNYIPKIRPSVHSVDF